MEKQSIHLSKMPKTWILDLDGTIVRHDGPFLDGEDSFLPGAKEFLENISREDMIVFLTARTEYEKAHTLRFLREQKVRYDPGVHLPKFFKALSVFLFGYFFFVCVFVYVY